MSAQIRISAVGVPSEKSTAVPLDIVNSADPLRPKIDKLSVAETRAMASNNMPQGRRP